MVKFSMTPFMVKTFDDVEVAAMEQRAFIAEQLALGWSFRHASITSERDYETGNDIFIVSVRCLWIPIESHDAEARAPRA